MPHAPNEIQGYLTKQTLIFSFSNRPFHSSLGSRARCITCSSHFTIYVELIVRLLHHTILAHFYYLSTCILRTGNLRRPVRDINDINT
jgi:hypothetical protein